MLIIVILLAICIALAITTIVLTELYFRERERKKILDNDLTIRSQEIISEAIKKAQTLLSSSELEALKLTTDSKFYKTRLEEKFDGEIEKVVAQHSEAMAEFTENLKVKFNASQQDYLNYIKYLKEESDKTRGESMEAIRQQVLEMFGKFETKLTDFLNETQKSSVESIDLEIKGTRQLIETYKQNQLKIIDENIIAMLERTLSLVLAKKLGLQDQIDLVYESLEKAKNEKFLI